MIGSRITALKKLSDRLFGDGIRHVHEFCKQAHSLSGKRNHLVHGIWGLYTTNDESPKAACYHPSNKQGLIWASEIEGIVSQSEAAADHLAIVFEALNGTDQIQDAVGRKNKIIHFGFGSPEGKRIADPGDLYYDLITRGLSPKD